MGFSFSERLTERKGCISILLSVDRFASMVKAARLSPVLPRRLGNLCGLIGLGIMIFTAINSHADDDVEMVAIVERLSAPASSLGRYDIASAGQIIDLGESGTLSIGYFGSCWYEEVVGGRVWIGWEKSEFFGGLAQSRRVPCDPRAINSLSLSKGSESLAAPPSSSEESKERDAGVIMIYDTQPFLLLAAPVSKIIFTSPEAKEITVEVPEGAAYVDLSDGESRLVPGTMYQVTADNRKLQIQVAPDAAAGAVLISRFLRI